MKRILLFLLLALGVQTLMAQPRFRMKSKVYYSNQVNKESLYRIVECLNIGNPLHLAINIDLNNPIDKNLIDSLVYNKRATIISNTVKKNPYQGVFAVDMLDKFGSKEIPVADYNNLKLNQVGISLSDYDFVINLSSNANLKENLAKNLSKLNLDCKEKVDAAYGSILDYLENKIVNILVTDQAIYASAKENDVVDAKNQKLENIDLVDINKVETGLCNAYKDYFKIGVALNNRNILDTKHHNIVLGNFNSITAENCMKPVSVHPKEGVWDFEDADRIANFCRANNIKMRGHCLVWHNQFADWMFEDKDGKPVSKEVFYQRLKEHIFTVVNRYKDVVYGWDVVNEAMTDDEKATNPYRQSRLYKLCGDEFIKMAFIWAHEADPNAILFYNDYNSAVPHKTEKIYNMVKKLQGEGAPISGIGMQGHYNIYEPSQENFEAAIVKFKELVKTIHITELDVRVNKEMGGQLQFSRQGMEITPMNKYRQQMQYEMLFRVMRKYKDVIDCVTFWNLSDKDTWLGTSNYPLLIDENFLFKDVYFKVRDFKE